MLFSTHKSFLCVTFKNLKTPVWRLHYITLHLDLPVKTKNAKQLHFFEKHLASIFTWSGPLTTYIHTKDLTVPSIKIKRILMARLQAIWTRFPAPEHTWTQGKRHLGFTVIHLHSLTIYCLQTAECKSIHIIKNPV